jgi:branched-chain amino acid transport system substrate-binding protein
MKITKNKIKIAVCGPFSGPRAVYGNILKEGIINAINNFKHDININFEVLYFDDKANPSGIKEISSNINSKGVCAVIGHFNSACALTAIPFYKKANIPFLVPASTNDKITSSCNQSVYRFCSKDTEQVSVSISFFKSLGTKNIGLISDDTLYGKSLLKLFYKNSVRLFNEVKLININTFDNCDAIFFSGTHFNSAKIINQLRKSGFRGIFLASDDSYTDEYIELSMGRAENSYVIKSKDDYKRTSYLAMTYLMEKILLHGLDFKSKLSEGNSTIRFTKYGDRIDASWEITKIIKNHFVGVNCH